MNKNEIILKVKKSIQKLLEKDAWLLKHDINERSITHKLAEYLQILFCDYNVDCEYNGNIDDESGRKKIDALSSQLKDYCVDITKNNCDKYERRSVYPDIIIHKRGSNKNNLCILEVKKSSNSNRKYKNFDLYKLELFTSDKEDSLKYNLGIYLEFNIGGNPNLKQFICYNNGIEVGI